MTSLKVVVLHNEVPADAAIADQDALDEARAVARTLSELGFDVLSLPFTLNLPAVADDLMRIAPAFVFNLVEPMEGRTFISHIAPTLLEHLGLPYTGCPGQAIYLVTNKLLTKKMLQLAEIATPAWVSSREATECKIQGTYFVKPVSEDSSLGIDEDPIVLAGDLDALRTILHQREQQTGKAYFAERYIEGREFTVSILGNNGQPQVLPPAEFQFVGYAETRRKPIVSYRAKWIEDSFEFQNLQARFAFGEEDRALIETLERTALTCWQQFGLRGYARVDFRVDHEGKPWVLEINDNPCLTFHNGGLIDAARRAGLSFEQVIARISADLS